MIKRFKTFISDNLSEAHLTPSQEWGFANYARSRGVSLNMDTPSEKAIKLSKHIMPEGTDSIEIPIMSSTMNAIHNHLKSRGYSMDYGKKEAYKDTINNRGESQRQTTSIGKALNKTKADPKLIDSFANDNHQEAAELSSKYKVIISRHPHDIAACSTNTPWNSCATLISDGTPSSSTNKGWGEPEPNGWDDDEPAKFRNRNLAAAHLPFDIKHGTHVAYLVPNEDKPHYKLIKNAKARILLKPFVSTTYNDTILSPETKGYMGGNAQVPQAFKDTLKNFTDTYFPPKENVIYKKDENLYDDDHKRTISKININKPLIGHLSHYDTLEAIKSSNIPEKDITEYLSKTQKNDKNDLPANPQLIDYLHHSPNFNSTHASMLLHPNIFRRLQDVTHKYLLNTTTKQEDFDKLADIHTSNPYTSSDILDSVLEHPLLTPKHIDKIISNKNPNIVDSDYTRMLLLRSKHLQGKSLDDIVDRSSSEPNLRGVAFNPNINAKHLTTILNNGYMRNIDGVLEHHIDKLTPEHIHSIINTQFFDGAVNLGHESANIINNLVKSPNFNSDHLDKLFSRYHPDAHDQLVSVLSKHENLHPKIKESLVNNILNNTDDNSPFTNSLSVLLKSHNFNLSHEHIHKILDSDTHVDNISYFGGIRELMNQRNFDDEHLKKITAPKIFNNLESSNKDTILQHLNSTGKTETFINNIPNHKESYDQLFKDFTTNHFLMGKNVLALAKPEVYSRLHIKDKEKVLDRLHKAKEILPSNLAALNTLKGANLA